MTHAWLLLPDFALIALGWLICRHTPLDAPIWSGVEKLVYYLLFPALLFTSIVRSPLAPQTALTLVGAAVAVTLAGVAAALALGRWPGVDARLHASGAQVAFRFNSYVALAATERLAGAQGLAAVALVMACVVPLCNVAAVWPLARHAKRGYGRELIRNPLILATLSGLAYKLAGLPLPELAQVTLQRMGGAALPLGLMAVGAGLRLGALREAPALAAALLAIRHALMPALGLALALLLDLPTLHALVLVAFTAMPTASSAYVLAVQMGGHGPFVASLVTLSTALAMLSLPLALGLLGLLR